MTIRSRFGWLAAAPLVALLAAPPATGYPLYGADDTGIRRLEGYRLAQEGKIHGRSQPPGALLPLEAVQLRLEGRPELALPSADPDFSAELVQLLGEDAPNYGLAVLDLSDPERPRYGEHRGDWRRTPGSVGKIAAAAGLFQALAEAWPDDLEARRRVLRETQVTADELIRHDHHKVAFWSGSGERMEIRPLRVGDRANLWSWLDWMLSASSNAAASTVIEQALLLKRFGIAYPPTAEERARFLDRTPAAELRPLLAATLDDGLRRSGLDLHGLNQGGLFTAEGKRRLPGGSSRATPRGLVEFLLKMEQGRLVDPFSSLELKRLLYVTERRIRYASSPALDEAAVYFKSGSLYACRPEEGFQCRKYQGNRINLMHSVAVVEWPAREPRLFYLVALMSDVLKKNSAVEHQTLAMRLHRLIEKHHAAVP